MRRLIDANALVTEIQSTASTVCLNAPWNAEWFSRLADRQEEIVAMIERQPKVDAVEVVHGRWMEASHPMQKQCSVCKAFIVNLSTKKEHEYSYCPNCGAKMDGDGNA